MGHPAGEGITCDVCTARFDRCMDRKAVRKRS
jgi:hypothetical protein